uniref:Uncharacterized protein n=1 Tax=Spongospora subterranea TaxID=70186 RepID=A0A0H5RBA1_9EUKA|eukprot:CRZ10897.1 hypothetical protein [Spongospora subterranea]
MDVGIRSSSSIAFLDEFPLFVRDLRMTVDDYRRECSSWPSCSASNNGGPVTRHINDAIAEVASLMTDSSAAQCLTDFTRRFEQTLLVSPSKPEPVVAESFLEEFLSKEPHSAHSSPGKVTKSSNTLASPTIPTISAHSRAVLSAIDTIDHHHSTLLSPPPPSVTVPGSSTGQFNAIVNAEMEQVSGFLRSRITVDDLNGALADIVQRQKQGAFITADFLERDLGFGPRARPLIMVLQQLNRLRATRHDGQVAYQIVDSSSS